MIYVVQVIRGEKLLELRGGQEKELLVLVLRLLPGGVPQLETGLSVSEQPYPDTILGMKQLLKKAQQASMTVGSFWEVFLIIFPTLLNI